MILFSSASDIYIFIMFMYLGVMSGYVFLLLSSLTNKISSNLKLKFLGNLQKGKKINFNNFCVSILNILRQIASSLMLVFCAFLSWYINYFYNYGKMKFIYILIWCIGFLCARTSLKIFAKKFLIFYNKKKKGQIENQQ